MRATACIRFLIFTLVLMVCAATPSFAQMSITVTFAPPDLPVYDQPVCPADGYIWTPGYWAWDGEEYYWVPGTWVLAPEVGYFWTPPYWAWSGDGFVFYEGYWAPEVGFYGGVDYGYGYFGHGYEGGRWDNGHFFYNRYVNNVNVTVVRNVYNTPVSYNTVTRVSYNGGDGGIRTRPTPQEESVARGRHLPPVATQAEHVAAARGNTQLRASVNHGKPPIAATPKPGVFQERGVVPAKQAGTVHNPPAGRGNQPATARNVPPGPERNAGRNQPSTSENNAANARNVVHPKELPPLEHPAAPNTGNQKLDQKYQQQQEKLFAKQNQERQKLQQNQDQEHQRMTQRNGGDAQRQQMEQRHQQQTQQMVQKHAEQQQKMQAKQQPKQQPARTAQKEEKH